MYEMLLGQSPFRGDDEDEIFDAILEDEPLYPITMPRDAVSILQKVGAIPELEANAKRLYCSSSRAILHDGWALAKATRRKLSDIRSSRTLVSTTC